MARESLPHVRLAEASRAMKALLANPDDTSQVFRIIEALSGKNGDRTLGRLRKSQAGQRLLRDKPELMALLRDHEKLRALPDGALGREYVRFLDSEKITAEGLKQASVDGRRYSPEELPPDLEFLRNRMRDQHDLWHVVTGYKGDLIGEAALLAFSFAQTWNPGVGFIVGIALLRGREPSVRRLILQGFSRGVQAAWLPETPWEDLLQTPVAEVRRRLRVGEPPAYEAVRTAQFLGGMQAA